MTGLLCSWHENGWGIVSSSLRNRFYLHCSKIVETKPDNLISPPIGSTVIFDILPPDREGRLPACINAKIVVPSEGGEK